MTSLHIQTRDGHVCSDFSSDGIRRKVVHSCHTYSMSIYAKRQQNAKIVRSLLPPSSFAITFIIHNSGIVHMSVFMPNCEL